jgi:Domain of Unknown Function (DUF1080)
MNATLSSISTVLLAAMVFAAVLLSSLGAGAADEGWVSLFDGKTLAGWKASENAASFRVVDGAIACDGPRAHLFYVGLDGKASFENFEAQVEVRARAGANSGFYFHTAYQEEEWPAQGFEVQVDNSQKEHDGYLENKMTGSLCGIRNVYKAMARDDEWFTLDVTVQKPRVEIRVNGTLVVSWIEPPGPLPAGAPKMNRLGRGSFAIQCHDPGSKVFYRNLRVRPLPEAAALAAPMPVVDERYVQILALGRENFPVVDLHAHLKGGLTIEQALNLSRATGMFLGIAVNCGKGFPVHDDAGALEFLETMEGQPVFVGLQAEGREWVGMFSKETRAKFDYVFTDSMTWTNPAGKRMRLWMPEEVEIGPGLLNGQMDAAAREQAFMDLLVEKTVGILETEPIDIYVNPTFLPAAIAPRYDSLWTEERMTRVIDAAVKHGVAIEINARYRIPSEAFLRLARSKGAKFTFGTNNAGANDLGDWSYPLDMQKQLGLKWQDMFVPGHQPSRAQRE